MTLTVLYPSTRKAFGSSTDSRSFINGFALPTSERSGPMAPPCPPMEWQAAHPPLPKKILRPRFDIAGQREIVRRRADAAQKGDDLPDTLLGHSGRRHLRTGYAVPDGVENVAVACFPDEPGAHQIRPATAFAVRSVAGAAARDKQLLTGADSGGLVGQRILGRCRFRPCNPTQEKTAAVPKRRFSLLLLSDPFNFNGVMPPPIEIHGDSRQNDAQSR